MPAVQPDIARAVINDNMFRELLGVARIYQTGIMRLLASKKGHTGLRLSFQPIMTGIPTQGIRNTDLAAKLGMSKQNSFQLLKQVEAAGYIHRKSDPRDKRARRIYRTDKGMRLMRDGLEITARIDAQCRAVLGDTAFRHLAQSLSTLSRGLHLTTLVHIDSHASIAERPGAFSNDLIQLANHCNSSLMRTTMDKGYPNLRPSYGQVLMHIGVDGARIQDIAAINDISKQAVGQLVGEIEDLGYIQRAQDPADGRSKILFFTPAGTKLISDSIAAADQLMQSYSTIIGASRLQQMRDDLDRLYHGLLPQDASASERDSPHPAPTAPKQDTPLQADLLRYLVYHFEQACTADRAGTAPEAATRLVTVETTQGEQFDPNRVKNRLEAVLGKRKLASLQNLLDDVAVKLSQ